jgi:hypothetical protein
MGEKMDSKRPFFLEWSLLQLCGSLVDLINRNYLF